MVSCSRTFWTTNSCTWRFRCVRLIVWNAPLRLHFSNGHGDSMPLEWTSPLTRRDS